MIWIVLMILIVVVLVGAIVYYFVLDNKKIQKTTMKPEKGEIQQQLNKIMIDDNI